MSPEGTNSKRQVEITYIPWRLDEKSAVPPPGTVPCSLFLSRWSSWRDFKLPSWAGNVPVSPLDCRFLNRKTVRLRNSPKTEATSNIYFNSTTPKKKKKSSSIFSMLVKFPSSWGIGPVSLFAPRSKTLSFFNKPISLGIVPIRQLPWRSLGKRENLNYKIDPNIESPKKIFKLNKESKLKSKGEHTAPAS